MVEQGSTHSLHSPQVKLPYPDAPTMIVIGGGFSGLDLVKRLPETGLNIIVFDRHNYHTFQPLLYQVATGGLEAGSIAYPLRKVFRGRKNVFYRMAEVTKILPEEQAIETSLGRFHYTYLVIATGTQTNFFGNIAAQEYCVPLKTVPEAIDIRSIILSSLERAVSEKDEETKEELTNFVIAGGGPTGVELAGALSELRRVVIPSDYPELKEKSFDIYLVDGGDKLLSNMSEASSKTAERYLRQMGVEIILNTKVTDYDGEEVKFSDGRILPSRTVIWAAGVKGKLVDGLPSECLDMRASRILVDEANRVLGFPSIFALGDIALMKTKKYPNGHPQLASVAKSQGRHLAKNVRRMLSGKPLGAFKYIDKGTLAVIGKNKAVADFGRLHVEGFFAWFLWVVVHIFFLIGFRNKVITSLDWAWNFLTYERFVRLILRPVARPERASLHAQQETGQQPEKKEAPYPAMMLH